MEFLKKVHAKARQKPARILFAEGEEPRIIAAAQKIDEMGIAKAILLKDPKTHPQFEAMLALHQELRGSSEEEAREVVQKPHTFAALLLKAGHADALISGPSAPSKERILPALQIIKSREKGHKASGLFFMILPETVDKDAANGGVLLFADCAVTIDPTTKDLAHFASDSAQTAQQFGLDPKIAFLTFSTEGSGQSPQAEKMQKAADLFSAANPEIPCSHDIQVDAALIDSIGERKAPGSPVAGHANVLIFPDLEAGNIAYKLVERLAGAKAIGPLVQGLNKPVNELSRGCDVDDIINLAALTSVQIQNGVF